MSDRRTLRPSARAWLHRAGYGATGIVALGALILAAAAINARAAAAEANAQIRARLMEASRTHRGLLPPQRLSGTSGDADVLAALPPPAPDSLRFLAMPSFSRVWFGVSLKLVPREAAARGMFVILEPRQGSYVLSLRRQRFAMPAAAARAYLRRFDRLTIGWPGEDVLALDGKPIAFDRRTPCGNWSGEGNATAGQHYRRLSRLALAPVKMLIPPDLRPAGEDWRPAR